MHRLRRLRPAALAFVTATLGLAAARAQIGGDNYNYLEFQKKPYYFGITVGYNSSDYKVFLSEGFLESESIFLTRVDRKPGLDLKVVTNLKVGDYLDVRFLPGLAFAGRDIVYVDDDAQEVERSVSSVFAEFPVQVRYKSAPWKDIRMFVLGGVKYSYDVASDSRAKEADDLVRFSPSDFQLEVGGGMQFFFPYFIFSPEVKFSHGLGNVLLYDRDLEQANVLDKVISRALTISLHFEG